MTVILLTVLEFGIDVAATYPPSKGYNSKKYPSKESFLPAEPGKTPKCAKDPRLTFCLELDKYPK